MSFSDFLAVFDKPFRQGLDSFSPPASTNSEHNVVDVSGIGLARATDRVIDVAFVASVTARRYSVSADPWVHSIHCCISAVYKTGCMANRTGYHRLLLIWRSSFVLLSTAYTAPPVFRSVFESWASSEVLNVIQFYRYIFLLLQLYVTPLHCRFGNCTKSKTTGCKPSAMTCCNVLPHATALTTRSLVDADKPARRV